MDLAVAVTLRREKQRIILVQSQVKQILSSGAPALKITSVGDTLCLHVQGETAEVINLNASLDNAPFFVILEGQRALAVDDYEFLFRLKILSNGCVSGWDVNGNKLIGKLFDPQKEQGEEGTPIKEACKADSESISTTELDSLKEILKRLKKGEFYEALTMELSERIREIADEMIACRRDLQKRIEPSIVGLAKNEIPETSNELEGINDTLEKSTMKILDISEGVLAECMNRLEELDRIYSELCAGVERLSTEISAVGPEQARGIKTGVFTDLKPLVDMIARDRKAFEKIRKLSMNMTEPLCFQDLVGQRIQRIVNLVKTMEKRVQDLITSLGLRIKEYEMESSLHPEEMATELGEDRSLLKGPQGEGKGLNQNAVDDLLASL
ncbi:MAG: hypothetical protein DRH12_00320 [Deltaproteobacteria bacterium]|nr:MAG: hypothetical protein DRH12_00320 [Deltaproteobacteria bacterium]